MFDVRKRNAITSTLYPAVIRRLPKQIGFLLAVVVASFLLRRPSSAHEGEEHGGPPAPVPGLSSVQSPWAQSDNFELVVKYNPIEPGKEGLQDSSMVEGPGPE